MERITTSKLFVNMNTQPTFSHPFNKRQIIAQDTQIINHHFKASSYCTLCTHQKRFILRLVDRAS